MERNVLLCNDVLMYFVIDLWRHAEIVCDWDLYKLMWHLFFSPTHVHEVHKLLNRFTCNLLECFVLDPVQPGGVHEI